MWALFGIVLSAVWLGAVYWWFREYYGLENVTYMLPGEVGQTLAGVAAVLALIWIVIAYLRNGASLNRISDELVDLREALRQRPAPRPEGASRGGPGGKAPPEPPAVAAVSPAPAAAPPPAPPPAPPAKLQPAAPPPAPIVAPVVPPPASPPPAPPVLRPVGPVVVPVVPAAERSAPTPLTPPPPLSPAPISPAPLSLGNSPDTAMLPPRDAPEPARDGPSVSALADEVARNLERLEAGKPPQPNPDVAASLLPDGPAELDPELQRLLQRVGRDLNAISMDLSAVLCRKSGRDDALKAYNRGQKDAFHELVREHLARHEPAEILSRLAQADATSLLHTYAMKFAGLVDEARRHDPGGGQEELLRRSALGELYGEVLRHTSAARGPQRG